MDRVRRLVVLVLSRLVRTVSAVAIRMPYRLHGALTRHTTKFVQEFSRNHTFLYRVRPRMNESNRSEAQDNCYKISAHVYLFQWIGLGSADRLGHISIGHDNVALDGCIKISILSGLV